ncbi:PREDICTED: uncharacterized protein LOC109468367 [Branchiostoma belcheri]|uniref:Uncharacterized protein LOC109468367 n=1 Tax=Branchiostoma belcheri TaxID=7741 RepID=A0A6P4YY21_BRABE|nr:PREDICTED: uncharacterized protein LOC109468367 [Branchiostoma belcheri]
MGTNSGGFYIPEIHVHPPSPELAPCTRGPEPHVRKDDAGYDAVGCPGKNGSRQDSGLLTVPNRADHFLYTSPGRAPKCSGKCKLSEDGKLAPNKTLYWRGSPEVRRAQPRPRRREDSPYIDPIDALRSNPSHDLAEEARYTEPYNSRKNSAYQWKKIARRDPGPKGTSTYENVGREGGGSRGSLVQQCACQCSRNIATPPATGEGHGTRQEPGTSSTNTREPEAENHDYHDVKPTDPTVCEPYMVTNMTTITQQWQPSWNDIKSSVGSHGNGPEENNQYEVIPDHAGPEVVLENRINMAAAEGDAIQAENRGHFFFLFLFLLLFVAGIVCLILRFSTSTFQHAQVSTGNMPGGIQLIP